jgi:hypothetical protein
VPRGRRFARGGPLRLTAAHRPRGRAPRAWLPATLALLLLLAPTWAAPARASTEEFSGFDPIRATEDDESTLDRLLVRPPDEWDDEWAHAPQGFRTGEGCFTSGQWTMIHQLKTGAPLGRRARFGLELDELDTDLTSYQKLDLWFLFPQPAGTLGLMFRPCYDKSRQDFAVRWEVGADSTAAQLRLTYGLEDLFNNLWVWRQTRVGEQGEPYDRHPWEPALKTALRHERWRAEAEGRWLTPGRREVGQYGTLTGQQSLSLWGVWARARAEARLAGTTWFVATEQRQARSTETILADPSAGDGRDSRRLWHVETGARRRIGNVTTEARCYYGEATQAVRPPLTAVVYRSVDRLAQLEVRWVALPTLTVRVGGLFDRISYTQTLDPRWPTWRNESRAYVGLMARCGRVRLSGVEGIELDPEPYEVWHHHDKGFLALQTTF